MIKRGGYAKHFWHRIGIFEKELIEQTKKAHYKIWIHAVSVGEIQMALAVMRELRKTKHNISFILSTTTSTAYSLAKKNIDTTDIPIYFPLDFPYIIRRVISIFEPKVILIMECELWPNLIRTAAQKKIPIFLLNGRLSYHSFKGYKLLRIWVKEVLQCFSFIFVQSDKDRERFIELGAQKERIKVIPSLKYDVSNLTKVDLDSVRELFKKANFSENPLLLVGGSTWDGEEDILLEIYKELKLTHKNLHLILIPRHVERKHKIIKLIKMHKLTFVERTKLENSSIDFKPDVLLIDTTGESRNFYAIADIIFVGKSLTAKGGQNIIEPAFFGKPIIIGPYVENFEAIVLDALANNAIIQIHSKEELKEAIIELLFDPSKREKLGTAAKNLVESRTGSIKKTLEDIVPYLN